MVRLQVLVDQPTNTGIQKQRRQPGSSTHRNYWEMFLKLAWMLGFWVVDLTWISFGTANPHQVPEHNLRLFWWEFVPECVPQYQKNGRRAPALVSFWGCVLKLSSLGLKDSPKTPSVNRERLRWTNF